MGFSRTDSLLFLRIITHTDTHGFYRCRFDLFAIRFSSQESLVDPKQPLRLPLS